MKVFISCLLLFFLQSPVFSQKKCNLFSSKRDSSFIESFRNDLIVRLYSGEKTHSLELNSLHTPYKIQYLPNGYFNIGFGVNYRSFGLSIATKIPYFRNDESRFGKTDRFGIQSYIYSNKLSIDLIASYLKGYYLKNTNSHFNSFSNDIPFIRPDISSTNIGISLNYIFNNARFSYKAAFSNTEKQKKSAGSIIAGGSILSYRTVADSAFVPRGIDLKYLSKSRDVSESSILAFNVNGGYAYSLIYLKNGIITFSYILGIGIQDDQFDGSINTDINNWGFSLNHTGKLGIGFRFNTIYAKLAMVSSSQYTVLKYNDLRIVNGTDFLQLSISKRISFK